MSQPRFPFRKYLAQDFDAASRGDRRRVFAALKRELKAVQTGKEMEVWLAHYGELEDAVSETGARLNVAAIRDMRDAALQKAAADFYDIGDWEFFLRQRLLKHPALKQLPPSYDLFRRRLEEESALSHEANWGRESRVETLAERYNRLVANMTVSFEGKKQSIPQMEKVLQENDRPRRHRAWQRIHRRFSREREKIDRLYDRQLALRQAIAEEAGFKNFLEYQFKAYGRDYTPEDSRRLHEAIERYVVPLEKECKEEQRKKLGLSVLQPWDKCIDSKEEPLLIEDEGAFFSAMRKVVRRLNPQWDAELAEMRDKGLIDLWARPGKDIWGWCYGLLESRLSAIHLNAVGSINDLRLGFHESGHLFHYQAASKQPFFAYRVINTTEFCEVPSISAELLGMTQLNAVFPAPEARRAQEKILRSVLTRLQVVAAIDSFEHWVYTHPGHSHAQRHAAWARSMKRFAVEIGGPKDGQNTYQEEPDIFTRPLIRVQYAVAQVAALQVWHAFQKDPQRAMQNYQKAIALGDSKPLPELYAAMGIQFDPRGELLPGLMAEVKKELDRLKEPEPQTAAQLLPGLDLRRSRDVDTVSLPQKKLEKV